MGRTAKASDFTPEKAEKCRALVFEVAATYHIPPVWITAKVRIHPASAARREVMQRMITDLHMKRWQVAACFGRSVRRVRKSVLGV